MNVKKNIFVPELDKEVELDVEIELNDVLEFIDFAGGYEVNEIINRCDYEPEINVDFEMVMDYINYELTTSELKELISTILPSEHNKTLDDVMKDEWFEFARKKYTLEQLESILGTKFDLM